MLNPSRHIIKQTDATWPVNVITIIIFHVDINQGKLHVYTLLWKPPTQTYSFVCLSILSMSIQWYDAPILPSLSFFSRDVLR